MQVRFGNVIYVHAKSEQAANRQIDEIDSANPVAQGFYSSKCCGGESCDTHPWLAKMITGAEAVDMYQQMGITVTLDQPKDVVEKEVERQLKPEQNPNLAIIGYSLLQEAAAKPIDHIYVDA